MKFGDSSLAWAARRRLIAFAASVLAAVAVAIYFVPAAIADEGWVVNTFDAQITIKPDASMDITETAAVNFGSQQKHGIFRDIPVIYDYDEKNIRKYDLRVREVLDAQGKSWKYDTSSEGEMLRIKIGDPDITISGPQTYRIGYSVQGALNPFPDHDELYWNVNGEWPVRTTVVKASVVLPSGAPTQIACYQGRSGSTEICRSAMTPNGATFESTRVLGEAEQLTIVVGIPKGVVAEPRPRLEEKPRTFEEAFASTPATSGGMFAMFAAVAGALGWGWWRFGRDRRFTTVYYLSDNPAEQTRPLLSSDPIVIEYEPPEKLRPGQLGLILDESADTLDVTATIVDLAVRGYLHISEVDQSGVIGGLSRLLGGRDWEFTRTDRSDTDLQVFEHTVLDGLFEHGSPTTLSALKTKFHTHLSKAKSQLYEDSMQRKWFVMSPDQARMIWVGIGFAVLVVGGIAVPVLGSVFGAGLVALPIPLGGIALMILANWMPKRTAMGREMMRRTLGFRQYVATAETDRQKFNEQTNLFSEYLPYAIIFKCVDKWARAFEGLQNAPDVGYWYSGGSYFHATDFSRNLSSFNSAVSSTMASTPGGSGSSGFSGGSSGGGGGGGGGGSW